MTRSPTIGPLPRLFAICDSLPEATRVPVPGTAHISFEVRGKRFAWVVQDHHGDGRLALHCRAIPGTNATLVGEDPNRYFMPPYLAAKGWVGAWLDIDSIDWQAIKAVMTDGYTVTAPRSLIRPRRRAPESPQ